MSPDSPESSSEKGFVFKFPRRTYSAYSWEDYEYNSLSVFVLEIREILQEWFLAIEEREEEKRQPDPLFPQIFLPEKVNAIIEMLDKQFDSQVAWASNVGAGNFSKGPTFSRLKYEQRLALCQQIYPWILKLRKHYESLPPVDDYDLPWSVA